MPFDVGGVVLSSPSGTTLSVDSGATNWMQVNASGILTRPQTPYMRGALHGKSSPYNGGGGNLMVTADVNFGGCWNDATGFWTCPVTGYYMTTAGGIAGPSSGYLSVHRNTSTGHFSHWNHAASWVYTTVSGILLCAAGDTIRWIITSPNPATAGFYGEGHGMYSIALLA